MRFIPDKEINLYEDDLLGTRTYVEALVDIVKMCDTPFTIGLLGGWGSGKSSIVKTLQGRFNNDTNSKIKVFIYDAWKYSKDSFRRTFILELKRFFNLDISQELESFYKDKHEEILGKVGLIKGWWRYLLLFLFPLIIINIKPFFIDKTFEFTTFVISLFFSALTTFIAKTFVQYKISISKPKTFAPEQFEEIFKEVIKQLTSNKFTGSRWIRGIKDIFDKDSRLEKVVIVIDNVDRCNDELVLELLLSIKNFLEIPNVVFIVPVDEEGIKKYLRLPNQDANEFLRKLFNTTIRIKKFTEADLFDFCKKLNEKYNLGFSDEVLSIVAQEFAKNPRRIIQFLNNLQSEVLLSKKIENIKGAITNNLPMLAKLLIIKEEWPELYRAITEDPDLLNRITQALRKNQFKKERNIHKIETEDITLTTEQYRFLLRTSPILTPRIKPFLINRDIFGDIPDEINDLVISQDWNTIKDRYINKGIISLSRLIDFISQKLDDDVIKRKLFSTSGFNLLALIFKIANDKKYGSELENLYPNPSFEKIIIVCEMKEIADLIYEFNSEELIKFADWLHNKGKRGLLDNVIEAIKIIPTSKIEKKQINTLSTFINIFQKQPEQLEKIKDTFSQLLIKNLQLVNEFKEVLKKDSVANALVTTDLITNFINSLKGDFKQDNTREKVELLNILSKKEILSENQNTLYIEKIIQFANVNNWEVMDFWFVALEVPFEKISDNISNELAKKIYDLLNNRYQWLYAQYTARRISEINIRVYKSFLDLCMLLYLTTDEYHKYITQWLNNFFVREESPEIYLYINELYSKIIEEFEVYNWPFSQQIIDRFVHAGWPQKKEFALTLNRMLLKTTHEKGLNQQQIDSILTHYLNIAKSPQNEQSTEAKNWIKEVIKNELIANSLQKRINSINNTQELLQIFEIVLGLKNEELLAQVISKIITQTPCENIESVLRDLLDRKADIEIIRKAVGERIDQLDVENNDQHRDCLNKFINIKEILDKKLSEKVVDRLRPLLASNDKGRQIFALYCLENLEEIPKSKKDLLKALVKEIKAEGWQEQEKEILNKIRERIK